MTGQTRRIKDAELLDRPGVRRVFALLNRDGEEARLVGGSVRNLLMGLPISDMDICTTALPDTVLARAAADGIHAVPTGYVHGTITLVVDGVPHEVTTLREDIETDGRRAVVRYGRDFAADALRRDFTINALSLGADGTLYDYADGLADIELRRVRFIGDADQRIREDYLRILRFFRFSAVYGDGSLEPVGWQAVLRGRAGLAGLSRERVRQETMKLLVAPQAQAVLYAMADGGFLIEVLGDAGDVAAFGRLTALEAAHGLSGDAILRLATLAVRDVADIERLRGRLCLTNREETRLEAILPPLAADLDDAGLKAALYRRGAAAYRDALLMTAALRDKTDGLFQALALPRHWHAPAFLVTGTDVMALGIPRGPEVGRTLSAIEARWIDAGMPVGREAQLGLVALS